MGYLQFTWQRWLFSLWWLAVNHRGVCSYDALLLLESNFADNRLLRLVLVLDTRVVVIGKVAAVVIIAVVDGRGVVRVTTTVVDFRVNAAAATVQLRESSIEVDHRQFALEIHFCFTAVWRCCFWAFALLLLALQSPLANWHFPLRAVRRCPIFVFTWGAHSLPASGPTANNCYVFSSPQCLCGDDDRQPPQLATPQKKKVYPVDDARAKNYRRAIDLFGARGLSPPTPIFGFSVSDVVLARVYRGRERERERFTRPARG